MLACFENCLKRLPTEAELAAGVEMVNGFPAQMLLRDGSSKTDFLDIMLSVDAFYEGLAIDIYRQLMAREPNSEEMGAATQELSSTNNYQAIQKNAMQTDEYAGFE